MLHGFGSREVYESASGVEGLEMARTTMPNIIITDLIMPDFDGVRFIKMVKAPSTAYPPDSDHRPVRVSDQDRDAGGQRVRGG